MSPYNLHLLWEPLLKLWTKIFENDAIGLSPDCLTDINQSGAEYVGTKAALHAEVTDMILISEDMILNSEDMILISISTYTRIPYRCTIFSQ